MASPGLGKPSVFEQDFLNLGWLSPPHGLPLRGTDKHYSEESHIPPFILLASVLLDFSYTLASQSTVRTPVTPASPRSLMEMQNLVFHPKLTESGLHFYKTLWWRGCILKAEKPVLNHSALFFAWLPGYAFLFSVFLTFSLTCPF